MSLLKNHEIQYICKKQQIKELKRWSINPLQIENKLVVKEHFHWHSFEDVEESSEETTCVFSPNIFPHQNGQFTREWKLSRP